MSSRIMFGDKVMFGRGNGHYGIAEWGKWEEDQGAFIFRVRLPDGDIEEIEAKRLRVVESLGHTLRTNKDHFTRDPTLRRLYWEARDAVEEEEREDIERSDPYGFRFIDQEKGSPSLEVQDPEEEQPKRKPKPKRFEIWHRADPTVSWRLVLSTPSKMNAARNWEAYRSGGLKGELRFKNPEDVTC